MNALIAIAQTLRLPMQFNRLAFSGLAAFSLMLLSACDSSPPKNVTQWGLNDQCDLHTTACQNSSPDTAASVTLAIQPQPIRVARTLTARVQLEQLPASQVELDISGLNMYMGYNRVTLKPVAAEPGVYEGQSMLAFCTNERMDWQITVLITQPDGRVIQAPFLLVTYNQ